MLISWLSNLYCSVYDFFHKWDEPNFDLDIEDILTWNDSINLFLGIISEHCTRENCPTMSAGPGWVSILLYTSGKTVLWSGQESSLLTHGLYALLYIIEWLVEWFHVCAPNLRWDTKLMCVHLLYRTILGLRDLIRNKSKCQLRNIQITSWRWVPSPKSLRELCIIHP